MQINVGGDFYANKRMTNRKRFVILVFNRIP